MKQNILLILLCIGLLSLPFLLMKEKDELVAPPEHMQEIACPILIEVKGVQEKIPLENIF